MHARVRRPSLVLFSVLTGAFLLVPPAQAAKLKLAVVDVQRAMRATPRPTSTLATADNGTWPPSGRVTAKYSRSAKLS